MLRRVEGARLRLKFRGLHDAKLQDEVRRRFQAVGVEPERLELRGFSPLREMLAEYSAIDVALDPLGYNGGTTSLLALWMGVPIVTRPGRTMASRQTWSLLERVGWRETVVATDEEYVELAVGLSRRVDALRAWRGMLRERLRASTLVDAPRFARSWEATIRRLWQRWCEEQGAR